MINKESQILSLLDILSIKNNKIRSLYSRKKLGNVYLKIDRFTSREKISILSDSMFKAMLFEENRMKYSAKFLSYYLSISYEELLKTLRLGKNELDKRNEKNKGERADYVAYYKDICINIEMNCNDSIETMERNQEYRHRLQSKKVEVGGEYLYTPVLQFNINNFAFEGKEKIKYIYFLMDEEGDVENDKEIVINIYVPNLYRKWYNDGIESLTEDERFLLTLIEPDVEKAKELGKGSKIMEEFIKESIEVSKEDDLLEAYDKEWALRDQGYRDGIEDGINEYKHDMVKKMLEEKADIEFIMKVTGLSKEEIEAYKDEN